MLITHPAWTAVGVLATLLSPFVPWHSVLLDGSQPYFFVVPNSGCIDVLQNQVRLFSDIDDLLSYVRQDGGSDCSVYALASLEKGLSVLAVREIGFYRCPQTSIKLRVYFDAAGRPWPAHSGQPQFSLQQDFSVEETFGCSE